jgi:hypothetical protein
MWFQPLPRLKAGLKKEKPKLGTQQAWVALGPKLFAQVQSEPRWLSQRPAALREVLARLQFDWGCQCCSSGEYRASFGRCPSQF